MPIPVRASIRISDLGWLFQADGKIVIVGESAWEDSQDLILLRLTSDLEPDSDFGSEGVVRYNGTGHKNDKGFAVTVQNDGKIVAAGAEIAEGREREDVLILRYTSAGVLDADFADGGVFTYSYSGDHSDYANLLALQADGKIVCTGSLDDGAGVKILLLRLDTNGALDNTFGTGGVTVYQSQFSVFDNAFGLAIQGNGKIVLGGTINNGANDDAVVLRYDVRGVLDTSFAENGVFTFNGAADSDNRTNGIAIQSGKKIVGTGYSSNGQEKGALTFRLW